MAPFITDRRVFSIGRLFLASFDSRSVPAARAAVPSLAMFGESPRFLPLVRWYRIRQQRTESGRDRILAGSATVSSDENAAQREYARCLPGEVRAEYNAQPGFARSRAQHLQSATLTPQIGNRFRRASAARQSIRRSSWLAPRTCGNPLPAVHPSTAATQ